MNTLEQEVRSEVESWLRWRRWLFLFISVFLWALALDSTRLTREGSQITVLLGVLGGTYFSAYPVGRWKGDTRARLLLALIDEQRSKG